ncbi:TPA: (4Fe-4S)-binding protein [Candidatus Acetothermia bacterium]|nr:(4Fe-4S)-binding protein [Candidatus Acetothermia bacterium]
MKSVLFLSGKGGTGKTSLAGAFAFLAKEKVLADCDVDAANLHLLLDPKTTSEGNFQGIKLAVKDDEKCISCGKCREVCRFQAIDENFTIDSYMCEGCGACAYVCPVDAITLLLVDCGRWYTAQSRLGPLASAELYPGEETSGKLVFLVKEKAAELAKETKVEALLIDGAPGIGCPVIASVSGVSVVILVTEPSLSGLHDLERILGVVRHFRIPAYLVINKADINEKVSEKIEAFAVQEQLPVLGRIPYDRKVTEMMVVGKSAVEDEESPAGAAMSVVFERFTEVFRDH